MSPNLEQKALLDKHLELVLDATKKTNLTAITSKDEAEILHVEDSIKGLEEVNLAPEGKLVDMGSGAGYPGIPLAILSGRDTTLVETVGKKAGCLESFISELNIESQVSVSKCRTEELAVQEPNSFAVASARALSSLPSLLELSAPLLMTKGLLVCYKSLSINDEIEAANSIAEKLGFKLKSTREYVLSDGLTKHQIVLYEKYKESSIKLPRKLGFAQKKPLA